MAARRSPFGECITHGVFVLLWALDQWQAESGAGKQWQRVSAKFLRPVTTGLNVVVKSKLSGPEEAQLWVVDAGRVLVECTLGVKEPQSTRTTSSARDELPPRESPSAVDFPAFSKQPQSIGLFAPRQRIESLFPALARTQPADSIAALLAATRIIGMKIPGEHSVFLQLDIVFGPAPGPGPLAYRLSEYRKSSQRVAVAIEGGGAQGTLWAIVRPAPVTQPDMELIQRLVPAGRFQGRRVLVVGGSRGLGEVAAKILAAGGAEVALTYRLGKADAERIVQDIQAHGGIASGLQLDLSNPQWEETASAIGSEIDHVCYFATPPIVGGDGSSFNFDLFSRFSTFYVAALFALAQWLAQRTAGRFFLFNASTVYVDKPPLRNLEYAAAKAASEACCRWLATAYPQARIYSARFPRLNTDQTASFLAAAEYDNAEIMLAELSAWIAPASEGAALP